VTTCQELVSELDMAGLALLAPNAWSGQTSSTGLSSFAPGSPKPTRAHPCTGALSREHSHFFSQSGQFGSLDWLGGQVDNGPYDLLVRPTVVIVDDDSGFRSLARAVLEAEGFDVVGEADDGASALAAVDLLHPRCARSATSWSAPGRQSQRTWA
jgi:hypothetical protein